MINTIERFEQLKKKFGHFVSSLVFEANLSVEIISDKFVFSSFFDLFENNKPESFLDVSNREIAKTLFNVDIEEKNDDIGPFYWAGIQYINLFLNLGIPMNILFLQCPLECMASHYQIYHEMNETRILDLYKENYSFRPIIKLVREKRNITIRELSLLTSINERTLLSYMDNNRLFNASFDNIKKLSMVLEAPYSLFKKESDFVPFARFLYDEPLFLDIFSKKVYEYFNIDENKQLLIEEFNHSVIPCIELNEPTYIYYGNKKKIVRDKELFYLIKESIKEVRSKHDWLTLYF